MQLLNALSLICLLNLVHTIFVLDRSALMPLSPITTKKKKKEPAESTQSTMPNNTSSHVMPDEFAELLWHNGPMMTQDQTKQPWNWKSSFPTPFPPFNARAQNRRSKDVASFPKIMGNDFPSLGHSNARDDDDTVPWISQNPHPLQDCLQNNNDFFSDFLNDFSLPAAAAAAAAEANAPAGIISSGQSVRDAQYTIMDNASQPGGRVRTTQLFRLPKQCQISVPNTKSEETCIGVGSGSKAHQHSAADSIRSSSQKPPTVGSKPAQPSGTPSVINFSHFSTLAAVARANLQTSDRLRSNDKASTATSTNTKESTQVIESAGGLNINTVSGAAVPFRKNHRSAPDDSSTSFRASTVPRRIHQAAVASSSVCSGTDLKHGEKRKHCQGDDSGHHGEDLEDEWVGCKKPPTQMKGTGAKRGRAAQVHNLSERRRRDRINEKMRALQELIPNSNKTDKASMLDEAIEYLKTLQLQLQMMSMGSGLCMPPMMMQHMRPPTMAHYSPMGLEMGMYEMNGSPGCCPMMIPLPPMQGPHFSPCPSIPGMQGLHRMPGTPNLQMYGIPAQGFHPLLPRQQPPAASLPGLSN